MIKQIVARLLAALFVVAICLLLLGAFVRFIVTEVGPPTGVFDEITAEDVGYQPKENIP